MQFGKASGKLDHVRRTAARHAALVQQDVEEAKIDYDCKRGRECGGGFIWGGVT